jgi:light-regulated signal transduction histidine kinase (bacteriophytochrome)
MPGIEIAYLIAGAVLGFFGNKFLEENKPRNRHRLSHNPLLQELPPDKSPDKSPEPQTAKVVNSSEEEPAIALKSPIKSPINSSVDLPIESPVEPRPVASLSIESPVGSLALSPTEDLLGLRERLKQMELAYRMAEEMSMFKAGFLARASHELRSPLSSLIGLHQLIISDLCENPEEEREFLVEANNAALKLVKLLDEVIAVAKAEHGTASLELQPINLRQLFQEVHNLVHLQAANRSLRLQISPPPETLFVMAEPRRLRQVLVNLIDRAILKMQLGGIRVSVANVAKMEDTTLVIVWIDVDCDPQEWVEPLDLLNTPAENISEKLSPGLNFLLDQTLMEVMASKIEIIAAESPEITRFQCSIPLATPITTDSL